MKEIKDTAKNIIKLSENIKNFHFDESVIFELEKIEEMILDLSKVVRKEIHQAYKDLYQEYVDKELSNRVRK